MYSPFKIFFWGGTILIAIGTIPFIRIAYLTIQYGDLVSGHIQSMILGALFVIVGLLVLFLGVISDLLSINRKLTEQILFKSKKAALSHSK
jgi:hypothetical protein